MTRPGPRTTGTLLAIAIAVGAVAAPSAAADPLGSARAQAAGLAKTVSRLQTQAEVATERYDGIEARLNTAVAAQLNAEQTLQSHQAAAAAAEQTMVNRARALYEGGGGPALLASLVTGSSPSEALNRFALASSVLAYERASDTAAATVVDQDASRSKAATAIAERVTRLQKAAARSAGRVQNLLNASRLALKAANGTVRRILTADQAAAAAAQARAFAEAVGSAGGTLDGSGSTTPPNAVAAAAIAAARTRLGDPYVWGATGPDAFDCSGLTQWSYAHAGITLPRTAAEQWNSGPHPSLSQLEPGDLLFWALNTNDPATIHHVTIYLGGGMMIAAPHTGENVQIQPVYMDGFIGATRPWANASGSSS